MSTSTSTTPILQDHDLVARARALDSTNDYAAYINALNAFFDAVTTNCTSSLTRRLETT
jgi:hypothetical protein